MFAPDGLDSVVFFLFSFAVGQLIHDYHTADDDTDYQKDTEHSLPHILQRVDKTVYTDIIKQIHSSFLLNR